MPGTLVIGNSECYDMCAYRGGNDDSVNEMHDSLFKAIRSDWEYKRGEYTDICSDVLINVQMFLSDDESGRVAQVADVQHLFNVLRQLVSAPYKVN